jgi:hypothetical protein
MGWLFLTGFIAIVILGYFATGWAEKKKNRKMKGNE